MLRRALLAGATDHRVERLVTTRPFTRAQAMRFVAGETLDDGIAAAHRLADRGASVSLDHVGEHVTDRTQARQAAHALRETMTAMRAAGIPGGVSIKPSQIGAELDPELALDSLTDLATTAGPDLHVTLDMEDHTTTETTVTLVEQLHAAGQVHVGCAVQASLHRTPEDLRRLCSIGASVRLCKGAYAEPVHLAHQRRRAVDDAYARAAETLLVSGTEPRFATHDHTLIAAIKERAARLARPRESYEFQTLFGIRPAMQDALVTDGYRLCVYVPFGRRWYAYFTRRIAERPANLVFFARALTTSRRPTDE